LKISTCGKVEVRLSVGASRPVSHEKTVGQWDKWDKTLSLLFSTKPLSQAVPTCPSLGQVGTNSDNFGAKAAAGTVCHLANYALSRLIFGSGSN